MASSKTFIYKITEDIQYLRAKGGMTTGLHISIMVQWKANRTFSYEVV